MATQCDVTHFVTPSQLNTTQCDVTHFVTLYQRTAPTEEKKHLYLIKTRKKTPKEPVRNKDSCGFSFF